MLAAILAGGRSSRMGRDKASLSLGNQTLLEFMESKIRQSGLDRIIICRNDPGYLHDLIPGLGPIGAIYTLRQHYAGSEVLIVPVDMPLLTSRTLSELWRAGTDRQSAVHARQSYLPLYLQLDEPTGKTLDRIVKEDHSNKSLGFFLSAIGAQQLVLEDADREFANVNTPKDWEDIQKLLPA